MTASDTQNDHLNAIKSLAADAASSADQLRKAFHQLERALVEALQGHDVYAISEPVVLGNIDDVHFVRGSLRLREGKLSVLSSSTEDDTEYVLGRGLVAAEPRYYEEGFDDIRVEGLRALAGAVTSLLVALVSNLNSEVQANRDATLVVLDATKEAVHALGQSLAGTAAHLKYAGVAREWTKAQTAIEVDPARAITAARSLVESVCKHVLHTFPVANPSVTRDLTLGRHLKNAVDALKLHSDEGALKMIESFNVIAARLGELRNEASDSHGRGPLDRTPSAIEARLAVNSAGVLATGLMEVAERHQATSPPIEES